MDSLNNNNIANWQITNNTLIFPNIPKDEQQNYNIPLRETLSKAKIIYNKILKLRKKEHWEKVSINNKTYFVHSNELKSKLDISASEFKNKSLETLAKQCVQSVKLQQFYLKHNLAKETSEARKLAWFYQRYLENPRDWTPTKLEQEIPLSKGLKNECNFLKEGVFAGTPKELGKGTEGTVREAIDFSGRIVAKKNLNPDFQSKESYQGMGREAEISQMLNGREGIVQTYGVNWRISPSKNGAPAEASSIFYECSDLGNLSKCRQNLTAKQCKDITVDILKGLAAMEEKNVVHGDIKPENILLFSDPKRDANGEKGIRACITDFGSSSIGKSEDTIGTPAYFSPERVSNRGNTHAGDLFSAGLTLYCLYTKNEHPNMKAVDEALLGRNTWFVDLEESDEKEAKETIEGAIQEANNDAKKNSELQKIQAMWSYKPEDRPSAKELLKHFE